MIKNLRIYSNRAWRKSIQLILKNTLLVTGRLKITSFTEKIDRNKVLNRSLVLIDEGKKRGIKTEVLKIFSFQTRFFKSSKHQKEILFDSLPLHDSYLSCSQKRAENKWLAKKHLIKHSLPTPKGRSFLSISSALSYARKFDFPLVVKPVRGSLSQNVTVDIKNREQLIKAIKHSKEYERIFVAEEYLAGNNYRILVIDQKIVGGVLRHPPYVIGNGKNTIEKLVHLKNQHPWRGEKEQRNTTLHKISLDQQALEMLKQQNLELQSIPKKGQKVYLHYKVNAASGADIYDVTDMIHPDNQEIFLKTAEIFDSKIIGIDFIAPSIQKSYKEQKCGIIEVNTVPYIDLHHYPLRGKSRNAAGALWEMVFKEY